MAVHTSLGRDGSNIGHWVDHTLGVLRGGGHEQNGVGVACLGHGLRVSTPGFAAYGNEAQLHIEIGGCFVKRRVGRGGQHHVGLGDPGCTKLATRRFDRHQNALSASASKKPAGRLGCREPATGDGKHIALHRAQRRKGLHIECIFTREASVSLGGQFVGSGGRQVGE